ncbi:MAG: aromatic ring-hydroxylating dioxygenase subunit alpha [Flavobacteriales bacterium]|nr:aromatic ring-hydroxylating dioxygenase subunit alpha [Flavobacteriales bacterium]
MASEKTIEKEIPEKVFISRDKFDYDIRYLDTKLHRDDPALPMWTYANEELLELEYIECFLKTWQFAGHISDLQKPGDYIVFDMWRDSAIVMVGDDGKIRAFQNVCTHRASRLLDGVGCKKLIQCHYHAWTFNMDGTLKGITQPKEYPPCEKSEMGLNPVEFEIYKGLVFVKMVKSDCLTPAQQFAPIDDMLEAYNIEDAERVEGFGGQDWKCNWKLASDNYAESYHVPTGHPGLNRMTEMGREGGELETGVGFSIFRMRIRASKNLDEARYQAIIHAADDRVEHPVKRTWLNMSMHFNMGIELCGEVVSVFQVLPTGVDSTEVRYSMFGRKNRSKYEQELIELNYKIINQVNSEDKFLTERIQRGAKTQGYKPGALHYQEDTIALNHNNLRALFPVASLAEAPKWGTLAEQNENMLKHQ